jgi:hypothetical protein
MADTTSESYLVVIEKTAGTSLHFRLIFPGALLPEPIGRKSKPAWPKPSECTWMDFAKMECPFLNRPPRSHSSPSFEARRGNDMHGWTTCSAFRIG